MSLLLESIHCLNGKFRNLQYHQERMNRSRHRLGLSGGELSPDKYLSRIDPPESGLYKCRVLYTDNIDSVEFTPYKIRTINSIQLLFDNNIDYSYKYSDRSQLLELINSVDTDDIIIVKNGLVTDSSYSNLAFFDGEKWLTPAAPLLPGTMRQFLIDGKYIFPADISPENLKNFESFKLINAMMDLNESPELPVSIIKIQER